MTRHQKPVRTTIKVAFPRTILDACLYAMPNLWLSVGGRLSFSAVKPMV